MLNMKIKILRIWRSLGEASIIMFRHGMPGSLDHDSIHLYFLTLYKFIIIHLAWAAPVSVEYSVLTYVLLSQARTPLVHTY